MEKYYLPLGASVGFCKDGFYEKIDEMKKLGFKYVDFDIANAWNRPKEEATYYRDLEKGMEKIKEAGLKVNAVHISFGKRWDPSDKRTLCRKKIVKKIVDIIKRTEACDPKGYVLHGSFEPILKRKTREKKKDALLCSLVPICAATKRFICLETLPRTCLLNTAREANEILSRAGIDNLRICLDTNHFLQEKTEDAVMAIGKNIATTHISDHDYKDERHWMPGRGKVDWNAVIGAFEKIGYDGVFNYELDDPVEEIKRNYEALFSAYNAGR